MAIKLKKTSSSVYKIAMPCNVFSTHKNHNHSAMILLICLPIAHANDISFFYNLDKRQRILVFLFSDYLIIF